jgi:hypothetical protein
MAQTYTLEQAAQRLGVTVSELKRRLQEDWKDLRSFRAGSTLHFRVQDIDEKARELGQASDPSLQLSDAAKASMPAEEDTDLPIPMSAEPPTRPAAHRPPTPRPATPRPASPKPTSPKPKADEPLILADDDFFTLAPDESGKGKAKGPAGKSTGDSDVKVEKTPRKDKQAHIQTEEVELDFVAPSPGGSSSKLSSQRLKGTGSGKIPAPPPKSPDDSDSEFELTLTPSSDEFELKSPDDSDSDEVSLGESPKSPKDVSQRGGKSGINLRDAADSGISLEKPSDDSIDFELNLDESGEMSSTKMPPSKKPGSIKNKKKHADSDSEFELTLDDAGDLAPASEGTVDHPKGGDKDIFETDFDIPALDDESGSEAVALEEGDTDLENSDFDLATDGAGLGDDESLSQVVELEEEEPVPARGRKRPSGEHEVEVSFDDDEAAAGGSASSALRGVRHTADEDEDEDEMAPVGQAPPARWGVLPALVLMPCVLLLFVGGLMGYELVQGMWGYHQPYKPASLVTTEIAKMFDVAPKE